MVKLTKTFIKLLVLISLFGFVASVSAGAPDIPNFYKVEERALDIQPNQYMTAFGLNHSTYDGSLTVRQTDLVVPLNGLDIEISRIHIPTKTAVGAEGGIMSPRAHFRNWELDIPTIVIRRPPYVAYDYLPGCTGGKGNVDIYVPGESDFDPVGKPDGVSYPDGAKVRYNNNWLMGCKNHTSRSTYYREDGSQVPSISTLSLFLISPDGTKYYFMQTGHDVAYHFVGGQNLLHTMDTFQLTDKIDKFGNWLAYDYKKHIYQVKDRLNPEEYQSRLVKIRSSEDVSVVLNGSDLVVNSIEYAGRTINYNYANSSLDGKSRLVSVDLNQNKTADKWSYSYFKDAETRNKNIVLSGISNAYGATVGIGYLNRDFTCHEGEWNLSQSANNSNKGSFALRILSFNLRGVAYPPITFEYNIVDYHHSETVTRFDNKTLKQVYRNCKRWDSNNAMRITKETTYSSSGAIVNENVYEWARIPLPNTDVPRSDRDRNSGQIVLSTVTTNSLFKTEYSSYDAYGNAKSILTKNLADGISRKITKQFYNKDTTWVIGKESSISVSDNDAPARLIHSVSYHNEGTSGGIYNNKGVEYETRNSSGWTSRVVDYFSNGLPKKIELNKKLLKSDGTLSGGYRYVSLSDYKHGVARTSTFPQRYSDVGSLSVKKEVDGFGNITKITDPNNNVRRFKFDEMGRLTARTSVSDAVSWSDQHITYTFGEGYQPFSKGISYCKLDDSLENCISSNIEKKERYEYDGFLRLSSLSHYSYKPTFESKEKTFEYDLYGNLTFESYWAERYYTNTGVSIKYDELNRPIEEIQHGRNPQITSYINNVVSIVDPEGHAHSVKYRSLGNLSYEFPIQYDHGIVVTDVNYNEFDKPFRITQWGNSNGYSVSQSQYNIYDGNGRLCKTIRNDTGTTVFSHNAIGEVQWSADLGVNQTSQNCAATVSGSQKILYTHDNLGELYKTSFSDGTPNQRKQYDALNNLVLSVSGDVEKSFGYYNNGEIKNETITVAGKRIGAASDGKTLVYSYSANGGLDSIRYPDGDVIKFNPNGFGEATKVERMARSGRNSFVYARNIKYHKSGQIQEFEYGNGVIHKTDRYSNGVPYNVKDSKDSLTLLNYQYSYDDNLNTTSIIDNADAVYSLNLISYDKLNRVVGTSGNSSNGNSNIVYDALGNIRTYSNKFNSFKYNYDESNYHLKSVIDTRNSGLSYSTFQYDIRGNIYNNSKRVFAYNSLNQIKSSSSFSYKYDAAGMRVFKSDSGGIEYSVYANNGKLLHSDDSEGFVNYIYLGDKLIAKDGDVKEFKQKQHFTPFGKSIEGETNSVGYAGHKFDKAIGLTYMGARYYDPTIGRFYSNDPIGWTPTNPVMSFNRYLYVNNNPYKYTDPDGKFFDIIFDIGFIIYDVGALAYDEIVNDGRNRTENLLALGADTAGFFVPGATGLGIAARQVDNVAHATKSGLSSFSRASEFGVQSYKDLKKLTKGTGLEAHHLVEQRFAKMLGVKPGDMASVALTKAEHQAFTNAWRKAIPYGQGTANATRDQVMDAAKQIYKDQPDILRSLGL